MMNRRSSSSASHRNRQQQQQHHAITCTTTTSPPPGSPPPDGMTISNNYSSCSSDDDEDEENDDEEDTDTISNFVADYDNHRSSTFNNNNKDNKNRLSSRRTPPPPPPRRRRTRRRRSSSSRTFLEHVRLFLLTGGRSRSSFRADDWIITASFWFTIAVLVGGCGRAIYYYFSGSSITSTSSSSSSFLLFSSSNNNNNNNHHHKKKPIMIGHYFTGIDSITTFTGTTQVLLPPENQKDWLEMLHRRLSFLKNNDDNNDDNNNNNKRRRNREQSYGSHSNHHRSREHHHGHSHGNHHHHSHGHGHSSSSTTTTTTSTSITGIYVPSMYTTYEIQRHIMEDSEDYEEEKPDDTPNPKQCRPQYDWQIHSFPNCNTVHEFASMSDSNMFIATVPSISSSSDNNGHRRHHHHHHDYHHNRLRRRLLSEKTKPQQRESSLQPQYKLLAHGFWRDTWMVQHETSTTIPTSYTSSTLAAKQRQKMETVALKTKRYHHEFTEYVYDKQRRDAITSDRLQFSSQTIRMYGSCGTSAIYEYAPGGDLFQLVNAFGEASDFVRYYSIEQRYVLAYNVTSALNDLHTTEQHNYYHGEQHSLNDNNKKRHNDPNTAAIVHGDFNANQFVAVTKPKTSTTTTTTTTSDDDDSDKAEHGILPHFKLGDFNLARFVYWNHKYNHPCVVEPDGAGGQFRAPEEYAEEKGRTEKVDIYSLGNLLYSIVTGHWPFDDIKEGYGVREMKELVKHGRRPHLNIDSDIVHSQNPYEQAILRAVDMCWKQDPHERASAKEVEAYLSQLLPQAKEATLQQIKVLSRSQQ